MRVTYLKLKNFVNVYSGMKKKEIEIDLSKSLDKLIVIVGKNGSGKTSILSELHPFASCGNMDVRSDTNLIIEGKDGYKEIRIADGDDMYIIKHNYLFSNKTKSVKSFISKNGEELNANGNVKSFKEAVNENLGLDQDLLKLMRLGSNVASLGGMKSTSRKSFATKLFSDLDVYNGFYKKAADDYKNIRAMMKNLSAKITKYNVSDVSEFESHLNNINDELSKYENKKEMLVKENIAFETKMTDIDISDEVSTQERLDYLQSRLNEADSLLTLVKDINMTRAEYELQKEKEKNVIESNIQDCKSRIHLKISERDIYFGQRQEYEDKLKTAVSDVRVKQLEDTIYKYNEKVNMLEDSMAGRIRYNKNDLIDLKDHVAKTYAMYNEFSIFSVADIKKVALSILDGKNIKEVIELSRSKMRLNYEKLNTEIITIENMDIDIEVHDIPDNACDDSCPYKAFYKTVTDKRHNLGSLIERRNKINKELNACDELYDLHNRLIEIERFVDSFEVKCELPIVYDSATIILNISQNKPLVNMNILNLAIDDSETFEDIDKLKKEICDIKREYELVKEYSIDIIDLENKILSIDEITMTKSNEINEIDIELTDYKNQLMEIEKEVSDIVDALELKDKLHDIESECSDVRQRMFEINKLKDLKNTYSDSISNNNKELNMINSYLSNLVTKREQTMFNIRDYTNITTEYNALSLLFDDVDLIKRSLTSSEGIPLIYLNVYLKNCPIMMNTLLDTIFDGKLQIDKFIIDDNEFKIPFKNDGILVPDIIYASQGESSFISIVLSLSLIIQSMTKYDIICLDELDGPLDSKNREEFIKVLYSFIDQVGCEQVFLISHNNMFDNEPVGIIQTSDIDIDNFKFGNILFNGGK